MKTKRLLLAVTLLLISAVLLSTASFAWFSMNTTVTVSGFELEAYSDALFLQISDERDGSYDTSLDLSSEAASRRLVTLGRLTSGGLVIEATEITDGRRYSSSDPSVGDVSYYQRVLTDETRSDTYEGDNFICIDDKLRDASSVAGYYNFTKGQISFTVVSNPAAVYDGTGTYYKKEGNTYCQLSSEDLAQGDALRGLYTVTLGTAEAEDARYDGTSLYYAQDTDGDLSPVGSLTLGTRLDGYYTVREVRTSTEADGETKFYLKNSRGDYVCIGTLAQGTDLTDYLFWARAYSASMSEVQASNTLNVLKEHGLDNYYLHDTLYLRSAPGANPSSHLRVGAVHVDGDDSLTQAVRVLFVATNGAGEVSRALYNHRTGTITHLDGDVLFDSVLGDAQEIVQVEVYVYFDGTDDAAKTQDVRLSGQTVSVEFDIDRPSYAP